MSQPDSFYETPIYAVPHCPDCEPGYDPLDITKELCYCALHRPSTDGTITPTFADEGWFQGDAGGAINRAFCDLFHRGASEPT